MAHFAEIKEGVVVNILVINDSDVLNSEGVEEEAVGIAFCRSILPGQWVQTSYSGKMRKQYASIGSTYDLTNDVFVLPQPFPSWTLDANFDWQPPTPSPGGFYLWDEDTLQWVAGPVLAPGGE